MSWSQSQNWKARAEDLVQGDPRAQSLRAKILPTPSKGDCIFAVYCLSSSQFSFTFTVESVDAKDVPSFASPDSATEYELGGTYNSDNDFIGRNVEFKAEIGNNKFNITIGNVNINGPVVGGPAATVTAIGKGSWS
ncbi:unnamed protein product [Peniophora sp. CBMAI 1063]|nr:unnamed protein product [Peniophora sp. CBMAI 1063]